MKILHFDCASGVSGDMTVGAFLDLGVPFARIEEGLALLGISDEFSVSCRKVVKNGLAATKFDVECKAHHHAHEHDHPHEHHHHHHGRTMADIRTLIDGSALPEAVKRTALGIFAVVAEAEAKAHGVAVENVHFHEVGAVDSIVDIVAAAICIEEIRPDVVTCSNLTEGSGTVECQHGTLPVPVPAVLEIARAHRVPLSFADVQGEMVTPTGIAICAYLAEAFGTPPAMTVVEKIGLGAGTREYEGRPNVLRLVLGEAEGNSDSDCVIIETNIDDMGGEAFGYVMDRLFAAGALDVFYTPIYMKKNRPAYLLTVLCAPKLAGEMEQIILRETTSIGVRRYRAERTVMQREQVELKTPYGTVAAKRSYYQGVEKTVPEYEAVRQLAEQSGVPFPEIYRSAWNTEGWKHDGRTD